jgi:hypothetical protein
MKSKAVALCVSIALVAIPLFAQGNRGTAEATIKGKKISIDYGRPNWGGQDRLGKAPVGFVWRLGMNQATHIETAADLMVGGKQVKAGKYTLWAKRTGQNEWVLLFHPKTGVWGVPSPQEGFIAETPLKFEKTGSSVEQLTISLADSNGKAAIKILWGDASLTGSFDVS